MRDYVQFWLDGEVITLKGIDPTISVLDWLRYRALRTGSKEGCAEGDCGACTVVVGALDGAQIVWRAVNACLLFLPMLDQKALITVESLKGQHPVQTAMVDSHGSQCGFCTPGIVMSLYARTLGATGTDGTVGETLSGNLCRCTGYGAVLAAANATPLSPIDDSAIADALRALSTDSLRLEQYDTTRGVTRVWLAPRTPDELALTLVAFPEAQIVAGATDVGLWVTKTHRVLDVIVSILEVKGLARIIEDETGLTLGAGVRYGDGHAAMARLHPELGHLVRRIGGVQVRNLGTIGGNIANGSPIGDTPPALIALGAQLTLRYGAARRTFALEDYFLAYGQQDRRPGEFVESVFIPKPGPGDLVRIVKLSKRFDSDISAVCAAVCLTLDEGIITRARVAFGGMAGTPRRAHACEAALTGASWSQATLNAAAVALTTDFTPLDDVRGSRTYRLEAAGNVLRRLWFEVTGPAGTVFDAEPIDA